MAKKIIKSENPLPLLPYLCSSSAIFSLVLVGELLALVLVLANGEQMFSWAQLGSISMVVQWILLTSALVLCQFREVLNRLHPIVSGCLAYSLCLLISALVLWAAQLATFAPFDSIQWFKSMLITAICSGILLRYLYVQQQLSNQQKAESQARLKSLQARIRPHFLFNTMNTIASLISIDAGAAEKAVEDLSDLFRSSLQDVDTVTLADELKVCRHYINIEQMRLADRLEMVWNIEEPVANILIPSLLLQPLLENAIYHGIQRLPGGGKIVLDIYKKDDVVQVFIVNPIPVLSASQKDHGNQIALANTQNRLQLHYKENVSFRAEIDNDNSQFVVAMKLPMANSKL